MRFAGLFVVGFWLILVSPAVAQTDPVEEFNEAYRTYNTLFEQGRHTEAIPHAQKALALAEELLADDPAQVAMMTYLVGEVQLRGYQIAESIETLERAHDRYKAAFGSADPRVADPLFLITDGLHRLAGSDDVRRAERLLEEALELYRDHFGKDDPRVSEPLRRLAYNALLRNEGSAAEGYTRRAVRLTENAGPEFLSVHVVNLYEHGRVALARRAEGKAIERVLEARRLLIDSGRADSPFRMAIEVQLVEAYERADESEKATEHVQYLARIDPDKDVSEPVPLFRGIQKYPFAAQEMCREGEVIVGFTIDAEGKVKDAKIIEANPRRTFDRAALEAVNRYRYKPRIVDGRFVETPNRTVRLVWTMERASSSKFRC